MSTTSIEAKIKVDFTDGNTRTFTLPNVPDTLTASEIEARCRAINDGTAENAADFKQAFISDEGAGVASIASAIRITTVTEEIYNG